MLYLIYTYSTQKIKVESPYYLHTQPLESYLPVFCLLVQGNGAGVMKVWFPKSILSQVGRAHHSIQLILADTLVNKKVE